MKKVMTLVLALSLISQVWAQRDYTSLHNMLIKFYGYQRAGLASGSAYNANPGFTNASHTGDSYNGNPVDGGWYDAGDYIKFGMPLGYAVYCLLKGYDVFPSAYANNTSWNYSGSDAIPDILNEVKFATDYLIKAVVNDNTIILDVGIASEEHRTWGIVNGGGRDASKMLTCSGADIPALYSACLALMSTLYRKYDATYADLCLTKAKMAFGFARRKVEAGGDNNLYCNAQQKDGAYLYYYPNVNGTYNRQIGDKLVAAGVELYRATNDEDPIYKTWAKKNIGDVYNCMGYTYIGPLASFEVWRQGLGGASSLNSNLGFIENNVQTSGIFNGIYQNSGWGTARDAGTAAFEYALAYVTTSSETARTLYLQRARNHVDWVSGYFGSPMRSYVIRYNGSPATSIHYRTTSSGPNGGLVSGPNGDGNWNNDGSPEFCEVAIDYNAGIIGAVAFLKALDNPGTDIQITSAFDASPKVDVNFSTSNVTFSAGFSKTVAWTIKISGAYGSKTYSGSGTSINQQWDGSADNGFFLSGEMVAANLTVDGNIVAYDIINAKGVSVIISKAKLAPSSPGDVLVDNFDDSDLTNQLNGTWSPFGNRTGFGSTSTLFTTDAGSVALQVSCNVTTATNETYSGVKSTFTSAGTPVALGPANAVVFNMNASKDANVYVELEQPSITDGAYYSSVVPVTTVTNNYRLNITDFTQPSWVTTPVALDLNNITALRFTIYDSTGMVRFILDNVYIDGLQVVIADISSVPETLMQYFLKPAVSNGSLLYQIPKYVSRNLEVSVFNVAGKVVLKQGLNRGLTSVSLTRLPAGLYTAVHYEDGKVTGGKASFIHTK